MRRIFLVIVAALIIAACGSKNEYTLKGEFIPPMDGKVILYRFSDGNPQPADTTELADGLFTFTGELVEPELFFLGLEGQSNFIAQFFLEASKMEAKIYMDSLESTTLTGSESHELLQEYMDELVSISESQADLETRYRVAQSKGDIDQMNTIRFEFETMMDNTKLYARNFIKRHSETPVATYVYLMNFFQAAQVEELDSVLVLFEAQNETEFYKTIQKKAETLRVSEIGAVAPDFTLKNPEGERVTLSSLKGKYVLLDFWASWCQPCMMEMPNVIEQYKKYKDKGFEILGVSLDREEEAWKRTIDEKKMNWLHVWDMSAESQGEIATMYGVTGIPYTLLLDKEGKIIGKNLRGPLLEQELAKLMN